MGARSAAASLAFAALCGASVPAAGADLAVLQGSVRTPDASGLAIGRARIVRTALTAGELAAPLAFSVTLRMRDLGGLRARIARGTLVADAEMEARYRPLPADYARVASWLASQGFAQTLPDRTHTSVFVRGSVADVARALGVRFARVAATDGEYTSAISAPSIPADLATFVLSVNGLQPEFRLRHLASRAVPEPRDLVGGDIYVTPDNVASAYNFPASETGAGQTIAIVGEAPVEASDLSTFWSTTGIARSAASVTTIDVDGGPAANPDQSLLREVDLDVEWAGAMAPGAAIRLYLSNNVFECFAQVQNDIPSFPDMSVLSISFAATEGEEGDAVLQTYSQTFASLAASGMSILAGSGDSGSNPTPMQGSGGYSSSEPLAVMYPSSDPSITGVGGTDMAFTGDWSYAGEVVWNEIASGDSASGGGVSAYFPKPGWQTGGALLAGETMRCVPDVAAISIGDLENVTIPGYEPYSADDVGVLIYQGGSATYVSGTSLSCPVWAAVAAIVNQARAAGGTGHIGLLNPYLYPLLGTAAFHDVTSGTNGYYSAAAGYDLCTGLGTPDVGNLLALLGSPTAAVTHRLVNVSTRAEIETGSNIAIAGFVIDGPAGTQKSILVRGVGPALTPLGVAGALSQPVLGVYDGSSALIASDTGWGNALVAGTSTVGASYRAATAADMAAAGAFALPAGSADSAMVLGLPPGNYTVQISGLGATSGVGLAEVYELDTTSPEVLANISARCFVGTGSGVAISGFVVNGTDSAQLLIRGIGPALTGFGLTGTLAQPSIALYDSSNALIVSDTGWGNAPVAGTSGAGASYRPATAADMAAVGAFALTAGSADSALVVTLPPGSFTAIVSGVGETTGTALAEVYEFSPPQ